MLTARGQTDKDRYRVVRRVGKGAYAEVFQAYDSVSGDTVALKQIELDKQVSDASLNALVSEIELLKKLRHRHIVGYLGYTRSTNVLSVVLEFCHNGSLYAMCRQHGGFPEALASSYIAQTLSGLDYLHSQAVIHRDIKGANILVTASGVVKLADFGVSLQQSGPLDATTESLGTEALSEHDVVGTANWMAPEVIEISHARPVSDVWSVGATTIELLTGGHPPYHHMPEMSVLYAIVSDPHPPLPEGVSAQGADFILQCCQKDPNLRASAKQMQRHKWLNGAVLGYDDAVKTVRQWNKGHAQATGGSPLKSKARLGHPSTMATGLSSSQEKFTPRNTGMSIAKTLEFKKDYAAYIEDELDGSFDDLALGSGQHQVTKRSLGKENRPAKLKTQASPQSPDKIMSHIDNTADNDYSELQGELSFAKLASLSPKKRPKVSRALSQFVEPSDSDYSDLQGTVRLSPRKSQAGAHALDDLVVEKSEHQKMGHQVDLRLQELELALKDQSPQVSSVCRRLLTLVSHPGAIQHLGQSEIGLQLLIEAVSLGSESTVWALQVVNSLGQDIDMLIELCELALLPVVCRLLNTTTDNGKHITPQCFNFLALVCGHERTASMLLAADGLQALVQTIPRSLQCIWSLLKHSRLKRLVVKALHRTQVLSMLVTELDQTSSTEAVTTLLGIITVWVQSSGATKKNAPVRLLQALVKHCISDTINQAAALECLKELCAVETNLAKLQHTGAVAGLTRVLASTSLGTSSTVLGLLHSLCRLSPDGQQQAVDNGIVPVLLQIPDNTLAFLILIDLALNRNCRQELWRHGAQHLFVRLAQDPDMQDQAYRVLSVWLQSERRGIRSGDTTLTGPVESLLSLSSVSLTLAKGVLLAQTLLPAVAESLLIMLQASAALSAQIPKDVLYEGVRVQLARHKEPVVVLSLLRLVQSAYDQEVLVKARLLGEIQHLDGDRSTPVLVRDEARRIVRQVATRR